MKLVVAFLPGQTSENKKVLSKMVYDVENRNCMFHLCDMCLGKDGIDPYFTDLFNENGFELDNIFCK